MSKTAQLEEATREAAEYFFMANQLKAKERNAVDLSRCLEPMPEPVLSYSDIWF
jgi:hypothetical protein